jgi:hypothetical protein
MSIVSDPGARIDGAAMEGVKEMREGVRESDELGTRINELGNKSTQLCSYRA